MAKNPELLTLRDIAMKLDIRLHVVDWIVRTRGIKELHRFGNTRVFSEAALKEVKAAVEQERTTRSGYAATEPGV